MMGLIGLIMENQSYYNGKSPCRRNIYVGPPAFFLGAAVTHLFHSRIATVTPVSHPLTRLIHISLRCWTIYRSFEITLEMGTVRWIELQIQIQCFIQMHCFKKHSIRCELCFKKYF